MRICGRLFLGGGGEADLLGAFLLLFFCVFFFKRGVPLLVSYVSLMGSIFVAPLVGCLC